MTLFLSNYDRLLTVAKSLLETDFTPTEWESEKAYSTNDLVESTDSETTSYFRCISAGTSGESEPSWNTGFWTETSDGTCTWRQEDRVYILDNEPYDFSYPCVVVRDIRVMSEIQEAIGNRPITDLRVDLEILSYMGTPSKKSWVNMRSQCFDVVKQVKNTIRNNPGFNGETGISRATAGVDTIIETDNVFFRIDLLWLLKLRSRT